MCFQTSSYQDTEKRQAGSNVFTEEQLWIIKTFLESAEVGERVPPASKARNAIIIRQDSTGNRRDGE